MTAYIITPEEHAMLVDALTQWTTPNWAGSGVDQCNAALSMLKAMKPVEHIAELMWDEEKQKSYMQCMMPIGLLLEGSKLYAGDKPPQVGLD